MDKQSKTSTQGEDSMKDLKFDFLLAAAKPDGYLNNKNFTDKVMRQIQHSEILSSAVRNMDVNKKETFIMRLKYLPKFVIIAIAIATLTITGGATYALYKVLWEHPSVSVDKPTKNQFGRTQVIASFENCSNQSDEATFEIKRGSTLDPSEVEKILQARCELDAIAEWSGADEIPEGPDPSIREAEGTSSATSTMVSAGASKIVHIDESAIVLEANQNGTSEKPLVLTPDTQFIAGNHQVDKSAIHAGDNVLYVNDYSYEFVTKKKGGGYDTSTSSTGSVTTHVIKVDLPAVYYGPEKQNQIAEREPCMNNKQDSCVQTSAIVLYENYSGSLQGFDDPNNATKEYRDIQGIIIEHNGATVKIQSSSGRIFTITTPSDIITDYNGTRGSSNNIPVIIGDLLMIHYIVNKSDDGLSLSGLEINSVYVGLNKLQKGDVDEKY